MCSGAAFVFMCVCCLSSGIGFVVGPGPVHAVCIDRHSARRRTPPAGQDDRTSIHGPRQTHLTSPPAPALLVSISPSSAEPLGGGGLPTYSSSLQNDLRPAGPLETPHDSLATLQAPVSPDLPESYPSAPSDTLVCPHPSNDIGYASQDFLVQDMCPITSSQLQLTPAGLVVLSQVVLGSISCLITHCFLAGWWRPVQ